MMHMRYAGIGNGPLPQLQVRPPGPAYPPLRPTYPYGEQQLPPDQLPPTDDGFWLGLSIGEKVAVVAGGAAVLGLLYYVVTKG